VLGRQAEESLVWSGKALELGEKLGLPAVITRAYQNLGMARCSLGDLDGMDDLRKGLQVASSSKLSWNTSTAYVNLSFFLWLTEGPASALATHRECIDFCNRRGLATSASWTIAETCWFLFDLGEWNELLDVVERVADLDIQMVVSAIAYGAMVRAYRGEWEGLAAMEEDFVARARSIGDPQVLVPALGSAVVIEHAAGRLDSAMRLVQELHDASIAGSGTFNMAIFLPEAVRACAAAGDLDLGERLIEADAPFRRYRLDQVTARAILAEARGELDDGSELYREAAEGWKEYGHVPERAQALMGLGRCLIGLGSGPEASAPLQEARAVFSQLGARPLLEETDAWLARATALSS
jgi:hypothetical protein